jgi:hypothetical protein
MIRKKVTFTIIVEVEEEDNNSEAIETQAFDELDYYNSLGENKNVTIKIEDVL